MAKGVGLRSRATIDRRCCSQGLTCSLSALHDSWPGPLCPRRGHGGGERGAGRLGRFAGLASCSPLAFAWRFLRRLGIGLGRVAEESQARQASKRSTGGISPGVMRARYVLHTDVTLEGFPRDLFSNAHQSRHSHH